MKKKLLLFISIYPIFVLSKSIEVDEILTQKHDLKMDMTVSYSNIKIENGIVAPLEYQTQNGDFVTIPTFLGDTQSNQDYLNYALSLKYGINNNLEIFSLLNLYSFDIHINIGDEYITKSDKGFNSWILGATYKVKAENKTPALLIGATVDTIDRVMLSNTQHKNFYFKGYRFFTTSYYTVDPLVFLLMASYRSNIIKKYANKSIDKGDRFVLSPQIYFAVNPYSSLNAGIKYSFVGKNRIDNKIVANSGSNIVYNFGLSYEINRKTILNISTEHSKQLNTSQDNFSMGLSYKF